MEDIAKLGRNIGEIAMPTFQAYIKRQRPRKESIFARPPTEHSYGPHERQKLDVYLPAKSQSSKLPCIVFVYGGGLVRGDKRMGGPADGVIYANVGKYFSDRGYVAVLPDYRLYGQHDAVFPSGGEDVGLTLQWVVDNLKEVDLERIFLIGNSAG
jgi:acetyl esterase/lipase